MKKLIWILLIIILTGCSGTQVKEGNTLDNIYGDYELVETSDTAEYITRANITEEQIKITMTLDSEGNSMEYTFWIGSFVPPENNNEPYTWTSQLDTKAMNESVNPMQLDINELEFTYSDNQISYSFNNGGDQGDSEITLDKIN